MPIYEYTCQACEHDFEFLLRSSSDEVSCPACGETRLAKRFSVPAAHAGSKQLPVCEGPRRTPCGMGGCGLPECGP